MSDNHRGKIVRPIRWDRLRTDEAEREIKRRVDAESPEFSAHAFDRMDERGEADRLNMVDVLAILRGGTVRREPRQEEDGWMVVVEKRMPGHRDAGVVTLVVHPGSGLVVVTVEWMDWK